MSDKNQWDMLDVVIHAVIALCMAVAVYIYLTEPEVWWYTLTIGATYGPYLVYVAIAYTIYRVWRAQ